MLTTQAAMDITKTMHTIIIKRLPRKRGHLRNPIKKLHRNVKFKLCDEFLDNHNLVEIIFEINSIQPFNILIVWLSTRIKIEINWEMPSVDFYLKYNYYKGN